VFGRRMGRPLRQKQSSLVGRLLPQLEIRGDGPIDAAGLFRSAADVRLEIGFGGGEHLAAHARSSPSAGFIGCEPFRNGVAKLLELIDSENLTNIRLFVGDAGLLIDRLEPASLAGVDILYPDPWPKRRQRKRRFISAPILARLARVMREGASFRFATDIDDYAGWVLARILRSPFFVWAPNGADAWRQPWPNWPSTRYEAKAIQAGRRPVYLTFVRTAATLSPSRNGEGARLGA
jgi:tRNA (guanine-N7-)-methyltransferase